MFSAGMFAAFASDDRAQARVHVRVAAAAAGRDGQLLDEARENPAALGVERAFLVLDRGPLGMAGHVKTPEKSGKTRRKFTTRAGLKAALPLSAPRESEGI